MNELVNKTIKHNLSVGFLLIFLVFLLLLFKDPFSERTLISNFEPYPDTFYYINPALNLVSKNGFNLAREGRVLNSKVPPLYSISLVPAFIIKNDPRMSYYTNVLLALLSLNLFWLIIIKLFKNHLILFFLLILYTTNYFIYWVPSLVMAENLTLTLYLASVFCLLSKTTTLNTIILAVLTTGLYITKYANVSITMSIIFLFLVKSFLYDKKAVKQILFFVLCVIFFFSVFGIFEKLFQGHNFFEQIHGHLTSFYKSISGDKLKSNIVSSHSWFGIQYIKQNLPLYTYSLIGKSNRFLWDYTPIVPSTIAIGGLVGILASIFNGRFRFVGLVLLLFISTLVIFMSTFYSFDARYIYVIIPSLLIGFGLLLATIEKKIHTHKIIFHCLMVIFVFTYLLTNLTRIKSQISLNLKYAETPWNYIAVLTMNKFFTNNKIINDKKPVLISAMPPYLIDYYSNKNYTLLPLSYQQEFRDVKELAWGPNDYSDLIKLYIQYLNKGEDLYVGYYGLGNETYTNEDFRKIQENFKLDLVAEGCFGQCNIYRLNLKGEN